jgi:ATP-dependent DNA helicase PIF1
VDITKLSLSSDQEKLFGFLERSYDHFYITGRAGTGKSVLLQFFKTNSKKRLVVLAPTGVAALNIGGQTIHSFFKIPPNFIEKDSLKIHSKVAEIVKKIDTLVIDEVSMVRADLMDAIDSLLRQARENDTPFGGLQMIMFGDLFQLPPIVGDNTLKRYFEDSFGGYYFFNASVWRRVDLNIYELAKNFRQSDETFKLILNAIREGAVTEDHLSILNTRADEMLPQSDVVHLVTTNMLVGNINNFHLSKIREEVYKYKAQITGDWGKLPFPTDEILELKKGAQIMMLKNDTDKRWVNGTIGIIKDLDTNQVVVEIEKRTYSVAPDTWNQIRYKFNKEKKKVEEEIIASFSQYPMRLCWAMTIHKSQGQTLSSAIIDMGYGAFANGQTYVALSRCKSLEGVYLKRPIRESDIMVDPAVVSFMSHAEILEI